MLVCKEGRIFLEAIRFCNMHGARGLLKIPVEKLLRLKVRTTGMKNRTILLKRASNDFWSVDEKLLVSFLRFKKVSNEIEWNHSMVRNDVFRTYFSFFLLSFFFFSFFFLFIYFFFSTKEIKWKMFTRQRFYFCGYHR